MIEFLGGMRNAKSLTTLMMSVALLSACGGGSEKDPSMHAASGPTARALAVATSSISNPSVISVTKVSEARVTRTEYDYVFKVKIQGGSAAADNVVARLTGVGAGATIIDGEVRAGNIAAGALVESTDTVTIRQDRSLAVNLNAFAWAFDSTFRAVAVDSTVPTVAAQQVTVITSSRGDFAAGGPVSMPTPDVRREDLVFGSNADGKVMLASLAPGSNSGLSLTATSTALALTRLMAGQVPATITAAQLNMDIQNAPEFPRLVSLVTAALTAGVSPPEFDGVADSIGLVLFQTSKPQVAKATRQSISVEKVKTPLPYAVMDNGLLDSYSIWLTSANADVNGVNLKNGITIHYAAYGEQANGTLIPTGTSTFDGIPQIDLPPHNPFFDIIGGSPLDPVVAIPGNGKIWNLNILQTPATRTANGLEVFKSILLIGVDVAGLVGVDVSCVPQMAIRALGSGPVAEWSTSLSANVGGEAFLFSLKQMGTWRKVAEVAVSCTTQALAAMAPEQKDKALKAIAGLQDSTVGTMLAPLMNKVTDTATSLAKRFKPVQLLKGLQIATLGYDVINTAVRISFFYFHWDEHIVVGVCQAINPSTNKLEVTNCPAVLELSPDNLTLPIGGNFTLGVAAKDIDGNPTFVPEGLVFTPSDQTAVSVSPTGVVTALKQTATPVTIVAKEPTLGITGRMTVQVLGPDAAISVSPATIPLGSSATLTWSSTNTSACSGTGAWSGPVGVAGSQSVTPTSMGTFSYGISCTGVAGNNSAVTQLKVVEGPHQVDAWVKYVYDYKEVNFSTANEPVFKANVNLYRSNNYKISSPPAVGDLDFICDARGNAFIAPGDCNVKLTFYYSPTPVGNSPLVYWTSPNGAYITSYDATFHRKRIVDVVAASGFTPNPTNGGVNAITIIVHSSWCPECPLMPAGPEGAYGSLLTVTEDAYVWVRRPALITDVDGNGRDDNGEQDAPNLYPALKAPSIKSVVRR